MSQMTNEVEENVHCGDRTGSQLTDEGNGGSAGGVVLKKGPWTSSEDAILVDYVKKHGEGNWNAVQKYSGLSRCGKSCRLRWANHLRPNLKKGAFTAEEERLIAELHAKMGNKWARMAAHLPGRTDNEIKNYWNTRIKRRQRAGLPLYPPDVCLQTLQENQFAQGTGGVDDGDRGHHDFSQKNNYEIHDAIFDSLKENQRILPFVPELPDILPNNILPNGLGSPPCCNFVPSTLPNHNHLQESTMSFLVSSGMNRNGFYPYDHIKDNTSDKIAESFGLHSPHDPGASSICYSHSLSNGNSSTSKPTSESVKLDNTSNKIAESFVLHSPLDPGASSICYSHSLSNGNSSTSKPTSEAVKLDNTSNKIAESFVLHSPLDPGASSICYSHSLSNGNSSTSKPTSEAVKLELPSLQYPETEFGSWGTSPPLPLNESVDFFIHSPQPPNAIDSGCSSPHNSGLLDALLYQAKTRSCSRNNCSDKSSNSSIATLGDRAESPALNMYETEWEDYADPVSPFGATSILNEHPAVGANGNSWDEWAPVRTFSGNNLKLESVDQVWAPKSENQALSLLNLTWPDVLLASDWHEQYSELAKNQIIKSDASDDLADCKHIASGTLSSNTGGCFLRMD